MMDADQILTVPEVAAELRCSRPHVYKLIRGEVPGVAALAALHIGRRRLVRRRSLERWKVKAEQGGGGDMMTSHSNSTAGA